jgi:hypothetical protein
VDAKKVVVKAESDEWRNGIYSIGGEVRKGFLTTSY